MVQQMTVAINLLSIKPTDHMGGQFYIYKHRHDFGEVMTGC